MAQDSDVDDVEPRHLAKEAGAEADPSGASVCASAYRLHQGHLGIFDRSACTQVGIMGLNDLIKSMLIKVAIAGLLQSIYFLHSSLGFLLESFSNEKDDGIICVEESDHNEDDQAEKNGRQINYAPSLII